jgi:membrane protease YdiL (CAAX protease family)
LLPGRARDLGLAVLALVAFYLAFAGLARVLDMAQARILGQTAWMTAGRGLLAASVPALVAAVAIYLAIVRVGGWSLERLRIPRGGAMARRLGEGLLWGVGLALAVLGLTVLGGARLMVEPSPEPYLAVALPAAVGLACAAVLEELLFRGFPLARLAEVSGAVMASAAVAVLFALAHWKNPDLSRVGLLNIGLASLLLSAVFFSAGGLPAAVGLHLGWNAGLALAADAPVSGLRFRLPALEYAAGPRAWWTGGAFGPEGGAAAAVVFLGALAWWWTRGFRQPEVGT